MANMKQMTTQQILELQRALTPRMTKYMPWRPTAKQTAALLMNEERELLYGGACGGGKDLAVDTPILTANRGWQTMGSIEVGDKVFGRNGYPCNVVAKSEVFTDHRCFDVVFDDGNIICAGAGHLWEINKWNGRPCTRIMTTLELYEKTFCCSPAINKRSYLNYPEVDLPCHPYAFGVWLGDGSKRHGNLACTDIEIHNILDMLGYELYTTPGNTEEWKSTRLRQELREMGFAIQSRPRNKRIPREYLEASATQRLMLLRGLMDTDGNASTDRGYCSICMVNKDLMQDIEELVRSFGIKVTLRESIATCGQTGAQTAKYNLKWSTSLAMFNLRYKDFLQHKGPFRGTQDQHFIREVIEVPTVLTQCIQVDSRDHLYLAGKSLVPTHNSVFLLMAALQYVDIPNYAAILFRKTFSDLTLPGALIPMSHTWLTPWRDKGLVHWKDKEKMWTFLESGATLSFGYLDKKGDHFRYQGAEFQFIGFDEVSHIAPESFRYLFSRLRRKAGMDVPLRVRSTANPGGEYGDYYYQRYFVDHIDETSGKRKRVFLQAGLHDNPHVDEEEYRQALAELDPVTRAQLEDGDWHIRPVGDLFEKDWLLSIQHQGIPPHVRWVRFWDLASIDPRYRKKVADQREPDWTVGLKLGFADGCYYIGDIIKAQLGPGDIEKLVYATAVADGYSCAVRMEEEGGASGAANIQRYSRNVLQGFDFAGVRPVVSKIERARPVAAACQVGNVFVSDRCRNQLELYSQLEAFPYGAKDDIVDAFSGAFAYFKPDLVCLVPPQQVLSRRNAFMPTTRNEFSIIRPRVGSYWLNATSR